jgi:pilus assembly protein CpaF
MSEPQPEWAVVAELRARVAQLLDGYSARPDTPELNADDQRVLAVSLAAGELERWAREQVAAGLPVPDQAAEAATIAAVAAALFGMGRLQPLLERADVENVFIHGADRVVLELAGGRLESVAPVADSDAELVDMLAGWAARAGQTGREFSAAHPVLNLRLPAGGPLGSRLAAVMEVTGRPAIAIRRHRLARVTLGDLGQLGTVPAELEAFLRAAVRAGCNIVVSGAPSAGKTTLLRALAAEIARHEHVITVEEEYELGIHLTDPDRLVTAMETRAANAEGVGAIGLDALLVQALRHCPSRVIVGEVRGGEVTALLGALSNGAAGGMCTIHARSAPGVLTRISYLAGLADPPLQPDAAARFIADAVDLIVHLDRDGPRRYVAGVVEVGPVGDGGVPDVTTLFGERDGGAVAPVHSPSPGLRRRLIRAGFAGEAAPLRQGALIGEARW